MCERCYLRSSLSTLVMPTWACRAARRVATSDSRPCSLASTRLPPMLAAARTCMIQHTPAESAKLLRRTRGFKLPPMLAAARTCMCQHNPAENAKLLYRTCGFGQSTHMLGILSKTHELTAA